MVQKPWSFTDEFGETIQRSKLSELSETCCWTVIRVFQRISEQVHAFGVCQDVALILMVGVAAQFYIQGAEWGDCDCMFNLGCCLELGVGVDRNINGAIEWYRRAATEHGDAEAMKVLTRVYLSVDDEENALLFAKRLSEEKQLHGPLIKCLVRGIGTAVDLEAARRLGWDGNQDMLSEDVEEGEEDDSDQMSLVHETPQLSSMRSKRGKEDEPVHDAGDRKRTKHDSGNGSMVTTWGMSPVSRAHTSAPLQSPAKTTPLQKTPGAASPAKTTPVAGSHVATSVARASPPSGSQATPVNFISSSPRKQLGKIGGAANRSSDMNDWSVDEVVQHFLDLGCDEAETTELRKQKIDGFALSRIVDWRVLFKDLSIPMGCCLKHDAFMNQNK